MNKLSGLYGILALLTGYHLSGLQLSMYVYSLCALILTVYLGGHIKKQSPLQCLALAWFYVLDSVVNAAYTGVFAGAWFLVLLAHGGGAVDGGKGAMKGAAGTMEGAAGFVNPVVNASSVTVGEDGMVGGVETGDGPAGSEAAGGGAAGGVRGAVLSTESVNSIGIIVALWTVRLYFCVIMLGWARMCIRQHVAAMAARNPTVRYGEAGKDAGEMGEDPFAEGKVEGEGWRGKLGRFLINIGRTYWLGKDEDDSWMYGMKFRRSTEAGTMLGPLEPQALGERERRRRSGTGPPLPVGDVAAVATAAAGDGKTLQVPNASV